MDRRNRQCVPAAACMLLNLVAGPASPSVITLDSQERVAEVHTAIANTGPVPRVSRADRVSRATDFGPFSAQEDLHFWSSSREPVALAWASASQSSTVLGPSVHAEGWAAAGGGSSAANPGVAGTGSAKSVFLIGFTVHEPSTVQLSGNVFLNPDPAEIFFNGPAGIIWHSGRGSVPGPFALPPQILEPGSYTLHAQAIGTKKGTRFTLDLSVDATMVDVRPSTWTGIRWLYR